MVFQDAGASLTPWMTVEELIGERLHGTGKSAGQRRDAVVEALAHVGLPAEVAKAQGRSAVRRSAAAGLPGPGDRRPAAVLLCDEPTSALDVSLAASVSTSSASCAASSTWPSCS